MTINKNLERNTVTEQASDEVGFLPSQFFSQYWQQKPLFLKGALLEVENIPTPKSIKYWSQQDNSDSRLVFMDTSDPTDHIVHHGPLEEELFEGLSEQPATVLIHQAERLFPLASRLLEKFKLFPRWRLEDIMLSWGQDQATLGPHRDQYDVFLVQLEGLKTWHVDNTPSQPHDCYDDGDLLILKEFNPSQTWIMEPGDVLYLPPHLAHHGICQGESLALSVGFRKPSDVDVISSFADHAMAVTKPTLIAETQRKPRTDCYQITATDREQLKATLNEKLIDDSWVTQWLGNYLSALKNPAPMVSAHSYTKEELEKKIKDGATVQLLPGSRAVYSASPSFLFVDGQTFSVPTSIKPLLPEICANESWTFSQTDSSPEVMELIYELYSQDLLTLD